jgi:hypothetical protein
MPAVDPQADIKRGTADVRVGPILLQKSSANGQSPSPGVVEELPSTCFSANSMGERRH